MKRLKLIPLLVFPLSASFAGGEEDARAVGMARAHVAIAENTEAAIWNPAALGIASRNPGRLVVNFLSFGVRVGNNIFSIPEYNKFNGGVWDEKDKKDILKLFKGEDRLSATATLWRAGYACSTNSLALISGPRRRRMRTYRVRSWILR